jgi:branched-chain amino acid aminotransferase
MAEYINDNGNIISKEKWKISPDNRSFRYGDGCFETIRIINKNIVLADYHFERLFRSLEVLKFVIPKNITPQKLSEEIIYIATQNKHHEHARVRLTFYRGEGGLYDEIDHTPNYIIQSWALGERINKINDEGLIVDFFPDGRKSADSFSNIKSNNFLIYTMGALWVKQNHFDDAIILNSFENIADATIANVFIIKNGVVYTPPLSDGAVNGVMRRYLLKCLQQEGIVAHEQALSSEDVLNASEVFFTNAIYGIRWVKQVGKSNYSCNLSGFLHKKFIATLFK